MVVHVELARGEAVLPEVEAFAAMGHAREWCVFVSMYGANIDMELRRELGLGDDEFIFRFYVQHSVQPCTMVLKFIIFV